MELADAGTINDTEQKRMDKKNEQSFLPYFSLLHPSFITFLLVGLEFGVSVSPSFLICPLFILYIFLINCQYLFSFWHYSLWQ